MPNTERGFAQLVDMSNTHHVQRVGIEGSGSFGRAVAVHLVVCWQPDPPRPWSVPTLMTSRERRGQLGKGKTDPVDALAIAGSPPASSSCHRSGSPPVPRQICAPCSTTATWFVNARPGQPRPRRAGRSATRRPAPIPILTTRARVRAALELIGDDTSIRATLCRRRLERVIAIDAEAADLKVRSPGWSPPPTPR